MTKNTDSLSALPLGGVGECGSLNLMVYECDGDLIAVDMGIGFPDERAPGVDILVPDITYLRNNLDRLKAIIITHAHEDHIGAVHYLWEDLKVPVYLTKFSRLVLEGKLEEVGLAGQLPIKEVKPGDTVEIGNFSVEFVPVNHSIPEAHGLMIRTRHGNIWHSGDYKFDVTSPAGYGCDLKRLESLGKEGVLAMFGDSTNVNKPGRSGSEGEVRESLDAMIAGCTGRIYFTTITSQIARMSTAMEMAVKHGRKIALMGYSMKKRAANGFDCGYIPAHIADHIVDVRDAMKMKPSKAFIVLAGSQGQSRSALGRLSFGQMHGHNIEKGDVVIHSALWIPGNEAIIGRMVSGLERQGAKVFHMFTDRGIYASGHAYREDAERMYDYIRPQISIPVHGDFQQMRMQGDMAREKGVPHVFTIEDGKKVHLAPGEPYVYEETFPVGRYFVDGYNILDQDRFILKERRQLMEGGMATVTLVIDAQSGDIATGPLVRTKGLIDEQLQADLIREAADEARAALMKIFKSGRIDSVPKAEEVMRQAVRRTFSTQRGRKPLTVAQVIEA